MDQWDRELAKAGIQMAGAAAKGMGNVMVAAIDGLIEKGVFSIEEVRDMLDRLDRLEGDLAGSGSGGDHDRRPPPDEIRLRVATPGMLPRASSTASCRSMSGSRTVARRGTSET